VLAALVLGPLALFGLVGPWFLFGSRSGLAVEATFILFGAVIAAALAWAICSLFRSRLEFLPTGIRLTRGTSQPLEIQSDEIEGYRVSRGKNSKVLRIFYKDASRKPVRIEMSFARQPELVALLEDRYRNLDKEDRETKMKEVLSDQSLGATEADREAALGRATLHAGILNAAAAFAVGWALAYPRPYILVMALLALLPVLAIGLVVVSGGAVTFDSGRNNVRPTAAYAILGPGLIVAFRALADWHILGWSGFWLPFAVVAGILCAALMVGAGVDKQGKASTTVGLAVVLLVQSWGVVVILNCEFDRSVPEIHRTVVLSRRVSHGSKSTIYYLTVGPWINGRRSREISVPSSTYDWHTEGSTLLIGVRPGALSMPWFFVQ